MVADKGTSLRYIMAENLVDMTKWNTNENQSGGNDICLLLNFKER